VVQVVEVQLLEVELVKIEEPVDRRSHKSIKSSKAVEAIAEELPSSQRPSLKLTRLAGLTAVSFELRICD
jgi:hypothetical protein